MKMKIPIITEVEKDVLEIKNVNINGDIYGLKITNIQKGVDLIFTQKHSDVSDFEIHIDKGVSLKRRVSRPTHDHDDYEWFQIPSTVSWGDYKAKIVEFGRRISCL